MSGKNELPRDGSEDGDDAAAGGHPHRPRTKGPPEISGNAEELIAQVSAGLMAPAKANTILRALALQRSCSSDALARPAALEDGDDADGVDYIRTHPDALKALASSLDPAAFQRITQALRDDGKAK